MVKTYFERKVDLLKLLKFNIENLQNNCEITNWNIFLKAFKFHYEYLSWLLPSTHLKLNNTKKQCQIEI